MNSELPQRMREIAETVDDWNAPLCAKVDLHAAAREIGKLQKENKSLRKQAEDVSVDMIIKMIEFLILKNRNEHNSLNYDSDYTLGQTIKKELSSSSLQLKNFLKGMRRGE